MEEKKRIQLTRFNYLGLAISILAAINLNIDYWFVNEFHIETIFYILLLTQIILNIIRHLMPVLWNKKALGHLNNLCLLGFLCFAGAIAGIMLWGYGYSGKHIPIIWYFAVINGAALGIMTLIDMKHLLKINHAAQI